MRTWQHRRSTFIFILFTLIFAIAAVGGCVWGPVIAEPATPTPPPDYTLRVEPLAAAPGDSITVYGAGWTVGGEVLIGFSDPQSGAPAPVIRRAYGTADIDANGDFTTTVTLPVDEPWAGQPAVLVIAWNPGTGEETNTEIWLLDRQPGSVTTTPSVVDPTAVTPTATETPTQTPAPTQTATRTPTTTSTTEPGRPTATATPSPTRDPFTAYVTSSGLNLRRGPSTEYSIIVALVQNTRLAVLGQNAAGDWLKVQVTSGSAYGEVGWVSRSFTDYRQNAPVAATPPLPATATPAPTQSPTVTPTAQPTSAGGWYGEYFDNRNLSGNPVLTRSDAQINFDWGSGSPSASLPTNNFSVRWTQDVYFNSDLYSFNVVADDGVRVWIGDDLILDQWRETSATLYTAERRLNSGVYPIRVEYYEGTGQAQIQFWWNRGTAANQWRAEYFANSGLTGSPVLVRNDNEINFDWGTGAPAPAMPSDNFSARWSQTYTFEEGLYRFHAVMDDGMRVYLDNVLLLDEWRDGAQRAISFEGRLTAGAHTLRVEYYERAGNAVSRFWWEKIASFSDWKGEYWSNANQSGVPVIVRNDTQIDFNWGAGAPSGLPADGFSARWTRSLNFDAATYRFIVEVDDGARVWLDGAVILDAWQDGTQRRVSADVPVSAGSHTVRVDYYERSGGASIRFWTEKVQATATPTPTLTNTPLPTATPTATSGSPVPLPSLVPTQTATSPATPTATPTASPTATATATATATKDTAGASTQTPVPIKTIVPSPTATPTDEPTATPTAEPTETPAATPTEEPTETPTAEPADEPTAEPTEEPADEPTAEPTLEPTDEPVAEPTAEPTDKPTATPTEEATDEPAATPTEEPADEPTAEPAAEPTAEPTDKPTATPTAEPTATPDLGTPLTGIVTGEICLPEGRTGPLVLYFDEIDTGEVTIVPVRPQQARYTVTLPVGDYVAYGWLSGESAVAYTAAVECGLDETCTDHSLLPFSVSAGTRLRGIDLCDWNSEDVPSPTPLSRNR